MPWAISVIILLAAIVSILYPLIRRSRTGAAPRVTGTGDLQRVLDRRDVLLRGIREVEYDKSLGNISDHEYRLLRSDYEEQAIGIYKTLDARARNIADAIDRDVQQARETIAGAPNDQGNSVDRTDGMGTCSRELQPPGTEDRAL